MQIIIIARVKVIAEVIVTVEVEAMVEAKAMVKSTGSKTCQSSEAGRGGQLGHDLSTAAYGHTRFLSTAMVQRALAACA